MDKNGLSSKEVERLIKEGKINKITNKSSKSIGQIFASNIFTYFNFIFTGIAILLVISRSYKNLLFLSVIIINLVIGIVQQIRAKRVLDKLALLDVSKYTVIRDGKEVEIDSSNLVEGDVVILNSGEQIPADMIVIDGLAGVNESLLTGEPDEIEKTKDSELKSGSFMVSGRVTAKIIKVGKDSYISQLSSKAKEIKEKKSEMIYEIERIIRIVGFIIIPIGIILIIQSVFINGNDIFKSIPPMVGAVVGMIPEGLYLLVTIALALSAARLAKVKVLLHDMKSIESLARVDILCVDKTGTITKDIMNVIDICSAKKNKELDKYKNILASYINIIPDNNQTMNALRKYFINYEKLEYISYNPFDSRKKYSELKTKEGIYKLGAPEFLLSDDELKQNDKIINGYAENGNRVLTFTFDDKAVLFIALKNELRDNVIDTFSYLQKQGVCIKVISGDNPITVSKVAIDAGIKNADKYINISTYEKYEDIKELVDKYTVFGRVKPEQKKMIIEAIKSSNYKVAMTGDGVNDILAMKEADCSIAMGEGSDAARGAAQVVLLDSDFSHMKNIIFEGRRNINNITRSASLFLYKNIFSFLLAVFSIIAFFDYPIEPSQLSLISLFNVGLPAFLLAMEPNEEKQSGKFIEKVLSNAIPAAITAFNAILCFMLFAKIFKIPNEEIGTASIYLLSSTGFIVLWLMVYPPKKYHVFVFLLCLLGVIICSSSLYDIFDIKSISLKTSIICLVLALAEILIIIFWRHISNIILDKIHKKVNNN